MRRKESGGNGGPPVAGGPWPPRKLRCSRRPRARLKKPQPALWSGGHFRAKARKLLYAFGGGLRSAGRFNRAAARIAKGSPRPPRERDHFSAAPNLKSAVVPRRSSMRLQEVETSIWFAGLAACPGAAASPKQTRPPRKAVAGIRFSLRPATGVRLWLHSKMRDSKLFAVFGPRGGG